MKLQGVKIGLVVTGSHCTVGDVIPAVKGLAVEGAVITPIFSYTVSNTDNRFYQVKELEKQIAEITSEKIIRSITEAEPIGPQKLFDVVVIAPCTGNTMAKLANGIIDSPALMAAKAHLRNQRPVVLAISSNDALGLNARNLGVLLNSKLIYFVPFRQDSPQEKSNSLVADMKLMIETIVCALQGKQLQPLLLGPA
ncbi:MAG: dipicolinate synthase subunit B [Methylocystaceae bacterium]